MIAVSPHSDNKDIAFHELTLTHDCGSPPLKMDRNPVTDVYTLRCECGLEVELLNQSAQTDLIFTAIDQQARTLRSSDVYANRPGLVMASGQHQ